MRVHICTVKLIDLCKMTIHIQVNVFFLLAALRSVYNLRKSTVQQTGKKESLQLFSWVCQLSCMYHSVTRWSQCLYIYNYACRQLFKTTVILLPILGLTWVFGLLSVNSSTIVFAWLFSIFNSLQGLFVFIFHVLRSEKVRVLFFSIFICLNLFYFLGHKLPKAVQKENE